MAKPTNGFDKRPQDINKDGAPKGNRHMSTRLMEAITAISDQDGTQDDKAILKALISNAKKGDVQSIKLIFNYLDGLPTQAIDVTSQGEKLEGVTITMVNATGDKHT